MAARHTAAMPASDPSIEPDTKDWTWVVERPCPECGYDARSVRATEVKNRVYANATAWQRVLAGPDVAQRPAAGVWSPLEYGCHVRDVHRVFTERVHRMLGEDDPLFANWDQDEAAVAGDYRSQDPHAVADGLTEAAAVATELYGSVEGEQWDRPGRRSNGSAFTVLSIARYHLHDVEHHLFDVSG
jgi:hypothetical protein